MANPIGNELVQVIGVTNSAPSATTEYFTVDQISGSITLREQGGQIAYQLVATRCGINSGGGAQFSTGQPGCAWRQQHYLPYGAKSLFPVYASFTVSTSTPFAEGPNIGGYGYDATGASTVVGGSGYAVGDLFTPTVATNQFAPTCQVDAVSSGAVTNCSVVSKGGFGTLPSGTFATTHVTGSGIWQANMTGDGIHFTQAGTATVASYISSLYGQAVL